MDDAAFRQQVEPLRAELLTHCYRMLGSYQDAEDVLQEVLVAAWRGLPAFEGRASLRTWLHRIATNRCLNWLRTARRRPATTWSSSAGPAPEPSAFGEVPWLEPLPDARVGGGVVPLGPDARYEATEAMSLAFAEALQVLPARQRAVLLLRDVLGFHAPEVAAMLDVTESSVTSALKRARATLRGGRPTAVRRAAGPSEEALVARFVRAYETGDVDGLVALLTDDVRLTMPPLPHEYHGIDAATRFLARVLGPRARCALVPTRANGQPAFGVYDERTRAGLGLLVLDVGDEGVRAVTRFEAGVLGSFGLPAAQDRRSA